MNTNHQTGREVHTTVRVPIADHKRLRAIAASECRSVSAEVRLLIVRRIAEADKAEREPVTP